MRVEKLTKDNLADVYCCVGGGAGPFKEEISEALDNVREKLERGWLTYAAYEEGKQPIAMAIVLPPSDPLSPVKGEGIYYLHCMDIHKDNRKQKIGNGLLKKILADVSELGAKGLATDSYGEFWMPSEFFRKQGFEEVKSFPIHSIFLSRIADDAHVEYVEQPYSGDLPESGIQVDIQYSAFCPFMINNYRKARDIVKKIEPGVKLRERMISTGDDVTKWGGSGLYVNGRPVSSIPVDEKDLKKAIEEAKRG